MFQQQADYNCQYDMFANWYENFSQPTSYEVSLRKSNTSKVTYFISYYYGYNRKRCNDFVSPASLGRNWFVGCSTRKQPHVNCVDN